MKIRVPQEWMDIADRLEETGVQVAVIGRLRRNEEAAQGFPEEARTLFLQFKIDFPQELANLKLSPDALVELNRELVAILRAAATRANQANRSEVTAKDVKPLGSR